MDSIFGPKLGSWSVHSDTDWRWNASGRGYGLVSDGGPPEMQDHIDKCRRLYGEPPSDCTISFLKD